MNGARGYAQLFETGQYGRFYITSGIHARGRTFHIQILPKGEQAIPNGANNLCLNKDAVEVYGIVGGNPGWSESYGWKHTGSWIADFEEIVEEIIDAKQDARNKKVIKAKERDSKEKQRIKLLLAAY